MRPTRLLFASALLVVPAFSSLQAQVIDQSNTGSGAFGYWGQAWNSQTFRPSANTVAGGGFNVMNWGGDFTGTFQIQLWSDISSNFGATMLASGSTTITSYGSTTSFFDVFWAPVAVNSGSQYFLTGFIAGGQSLVSTFSDDNYAGGEAYFNYSTDVMNPPSAFLGLDLAFEEFSENGVTAPEPASVVLLATGLLGIGGIVRRRRK